MLEVSWVDIWIRGQNSINSILLPLRLLSMKSSRTNLSGRKNASIVEVWVCLINFLTIIYCVLISNWTYWCFFFWEILFGLNYVGTLWVNIDSASHKNNHVLRIEWLRRPIFISWLCPSKCLNTLLSSEIIWWLRSSLIALAIRCV